MEIGFVAEELLKLALRSLFNIIDLLDRFVEHLAETAAGLRRRLSGRRRRHHSWNVAVNLEVTHNRYLPRSSVRLIIVFTMPIAAILAS